MGAKISLTLPVLSVAILFLVFIRPEITGFVVAPDNVLRADIKVTTADGVILPADSEIEVSIGDLASSMPVSLFIQKSGGHYELVEGEVPELGYRGPGYAGNHTYILPISDFNLSGRVGQGMHIIRVEITYKGTIISENEREVLV
jgi:hypothetical protein